MKDFKIKIITLTTILFGCSVDNEMSQLERLTDYEGRYEYSNPKSLVIAASSFDTTLYAIIDDAQYPLKYISKDTFESPQKSPVIFQRGEENDVQSYLTEGNVSIDYLRQNSFSTPQRCSTSICCVTSHRSL